MPPRVPTARLPSFGKAPSRPKVESKKERGRFYASTAWRRVRAAFLAANPLCRDCEAEGLLAAATIAHHHEERLDRPDLALDPENLVPLCDRHHTAEHDRRRRRPRGGGRIPGPGRP